MKIKTWRACLLAMAVLYCAVIQTEGTTFPISAATNLINNPFPVVATDGSNYLVGFQTVRQDGTTEPVARFVSSGGVPIGQLIKSGRTGDPPGAIAFGGVNYFIAWADYSASSNGTVPVFGALINQTGPNMGAPFQVSQSTTVERMDAAAFGGTNFLVTWTDKRRAGSGPGDKDIYARLVSVNGIPQGSDFKISGAGGAESAIAFDGFNFLVVWRDDVVDTDICGRFISSSGTYSSGEFFIDSNGFPSDNPSTVIFDGTRYVVVIEDEVGGQSTESWDLYARFVNLFGGVDFTRVTISSASGSQRFPGIAFDGANYLATWNDGLILTNAGNTNVNVKARFVNSTGNPISSEFTLFSAQGNRIPVTGPVLFDGKEFFAASGLTEVVTNGTGGINGLTNGTILGALVPTSTASPRLEILPPFAGGQFKLRISGTPGMNYAVDVTANGLSTTSAWTSLVTNSPANGFFDFTDTNAVGSGRFYRAVKR